MSEDTPQYAKSEEGNQVPVRYEGSSFSQTDSQGNSLLTGENIGPSSPLVGENYEHNSDRAHNMAAAGNDERTFASNARFDAKRDEDYRSSQDLGPGQEAYYDSGIRSSYRRAERADARADKVEHWASILHDHPVSEEYEESHPEVRFTPEGLMHYEELLQYRKDDLAKVEEEYTSNEDWGMVKLPVALQTYVLDKSPLPVPGSEDYEQRHEEAQLDPELAILLSNPDTTLNKLRLYFMDLEKKQFQGWVDDAEKVLDDVRRGRTIVATEPTPEVSTPNQ